MPGFGSGLAHAIAEGVEGYDSGELTNLQQRLAMAQWLRTDRRENQKMDIERLNTLAKAAEAGLNVTPQSSGTPGDTPPTGQQPVDGISSEAGPAAKAPPTRIGSVGGYDIQIPEGGVGSKAVRDKKELIRAGLEKKPQQTLRERILELRGQGVAPMDAVRQARQEFGMDPPFADRRKIEATTPIPRQPPNPTTESDHRRNYILRRAADLQKDHKVGYRVVRGVDRATAEQQAADEYDSVYNSEAAPRSTTPGQDQTKPQAGAATRTPPNPRKPANDPRLNRTGGPAGAPVLAPDNPFADLVPKK